MSALMVIGSAVLLLALSGLRVLRAARTEPGGPERWLGLALLCAALGLPLRLLTVHALQDVSEVPAPLAVLNAVGHAALSLSPAFLFRFVRQVFHPDGRRARQAELAMHVAIAATFVWVVASVGALREAHPSVIAANVVRGLAFPWACFESLRYWLRMRRRLALGLADPVVTNRFALWSLWTGVLAALPVVVLAARAAAYGAVGDERAEVLRAVLPIVRLTILVGVTTAFVCIWLSFFPPRAWVARLRAKAAPA